jgi:hypothetical protein
MLKSVEAIDPETLLVPKGGTKGPLDGFSAAENAVTNHFMVSTGFGTSPENQRKRRIDPEGKLS